MSSHSSQAPRSVAKPSTAVEVLLGLGSNIRRDYHLQAGLAALRAEFGTVECSPFYESAAVGFAGSPFYNGVAAIRTELSVDELNRWLKALEDGFGRDRSQPKFSSRNLDVDILTCGDLHGWIEGVQLPRSEVFRHAFVLKPLADLRPQGQVPGEQRTWGELWAQIGDSLQPLHPVELAPLASSLPLG
ncbi:2-amino-4-hydroxy-6-hydroxymethyldihydropteridine diphosphokinase [Natronospirillum operosum]|uniref:2-amino-4-hydroxy-6-hydroxymethyldihydropteridine diphosphokinase n=1 Tax=Natronospirillum operosum TaxID=2759953 RepID=A0A4Z0WC98_9GAMM|nr:2-amino-4-hydroxy-6-hydroxymethyldihydropteridine diphosphokinase [Natronospirillum operosum]TGG92495.1 2-amino-4-hydroxy-6-hydroxymethyldihydropteridine diphosphokinase [Natronospirillum operosum]